MSQRAIDETHEHTLRSWVASANSPGNDFPLQNLPFGVFRRTGGHERWRGGVAIGDQVLDLSQLHALRLAKGSTADALAAAAAPELNAFMALGRDAWQALRHFLFSALRAGSDHQAAMTAALAPQSAVEYTLPARIGDYTDFYASIHHATSVGKLLRPDNPLLPNYKWIPIGYHGRSSSIGVARQDFVRPMGQTMPPGAAQPMFGPSKRLDYELELGLFVGPGNALGQPIPIEHAEDHIFGVCLLNDWSARDLQAWEYQPLGPFLAKNFATTISPWVVTLEALAPFRCTWERASVDPQPLPYLDGVALRTSGGIDVQIAASLQSARMRAADLAPQRLSQSNVRHSYWAMSQLLAHHASNGCNLRPGDLLGSGTQSGPTAEEAGSLLELSFGGKQSLQLSSGETRTFLEDGDCVRYTGWCERAGFQRIGLGVASGTVLPAQSAIPKV